MSGTLQASTSRLPPRWCPPVPTWAPPPDRGEEDGRHPWQNRRWSTRWGDDASASRAGSSVGSSRRCSPSPAGGSRSRAGRRQRW